MKVTEPTNAYFQIGNQQLWVQQMIMGRSTSAPVLVFLHDALGSVAQWGDFPQKLAMKSGLSAVVYDRSGHGASGPLTQIRSQQYLHQEALEVLPELLQQLQIQHPILIGHSDGGTIALIYGACHQPAAIITEAAHTFVEEITLEGIRTAVAKKAQLLPKLAAYHGNKTELLFHAWADTWRDECFRDWSIEVLLPRISCPVLAIQGKEDPYGSGEQVRRIVNGVGSRAEAYWVERCGHIPHRQSERAVLEKMSSFIEEILNFALPNKTWPYERKMELCQWHLQQTLDR